MGYRHYLGVIDKDKLEELRKKVYKKEDLEEDQDIDSERFWELIHNCDYRYEIGDTDKEIDDELYKTQEIIVEDDDSYKIFICSQNIFVELANLFLQKTKRYFQNLIKPFEKENSFKTIKKLSDEQIVALRKILNSLDEKIIYLSGEHFYSNSKDIEISWLYEYCAFNLAHIHKTIDFEKQVVICFAE